MQPLQQENFVREGAICYTNPVFEGYLADPFVFEHAGVYYAVGTGPVAEDGFEFPILSSPDLFHWEALGGALIRPDFEARRFWAPEVAEQGGEFFLYYSAGVSDEGHELRVAKSAFPQGPYVDLGAPVLDPRSTPFAIDPSPFRDDDGQWYLFYARDFLDVDGVSRAGTGLVVAPLIDMVRVPDEFTVVMRARHDWQAYVWQRPIYGGVYDWHTLEGPCVQKHGGRYYCLYSGGNWQNDSYGLDFVVADSPLGPWVDSNPGDGPRVLKTVPGRVLGPGHNSVVSGPGGELFLAYHAWDLAKTARRLCLDRLIWTEDGPRGLGPTWEPQFLSTP